MTRLQTALAIVVSLAATSSHSAHAGGDPPANSLDGKSFEGDGGMDTQEGQCPVAAAGVALDVHDPAPRSVFFEVEISSAPNGVGQVFGNADPAAWSASGNIGTLTISAATHESMRSGGGWTPVPGSFDPIVIQIDLTTLEATSTPASGAIEM